MSLDSTFFGTPIHVNVELESNYYRHHRAHFKIQYRSKPCVFLPRKGTVFVPISNVVVNGPYFDPEDPRFDLMGKIVIINGFTCSPEDNLFEEAALWMEMGTTYEIHSETKLLTRVRKFLGDTALLVEEKSVHS